MSLNIRGKRDEHLDRIMQVLAEYESQHPHTQIEAYRQNSVSIRIRIIDPEFAGISRAQRHENIWRYLEELPEETQSQVSLLILLTPKEKDSSLASIDFDDPIPSRL